MKKLCYICHGLGANGIDTFIVNILSAIDKTKYDISLILAVDEGAEQFNEQKVRDLGIPIYRTNDMWNIRCKFSHYYKLKKLLRKIKPDIVHSNMGFLDGINCMAAKRSGVPMRISHAHSSQSVKDAGKGKYSLSKIYHDAYHKIMKLFVKHYATYFLGCSEEAIDYYFGHEYLGNEKATVIYNGIRLNKFLSLKRDECMKQLGFNDETHRIISIGHLAAQKNPFFIIDVMRELCFIRKDVELLWLGSGPLEKAIKEKVSGGGISRYVKMLGIRDDVNKILACGDVFLFPSLFEGLGIVLIEAQATGLPCVASMGVPKIADCGKLIRISLEEGAKKFAQTISDILDGKIQLQIDEEKLWKFDISYTVKQLEKIYSTV